MEVFLEQQGRTSGSGASQVERTCGFGSSSLLRESEENHCGGDISSLFPPPWEQSPRNPETHTAPLHLLCLLMVGDEGHHSAFPPA